MFTFSRRYFEDPVFFIQEHSRRCDQVARQRRAEYWMDSG
jgi:hypothetical protein